MSSLCFKLVIVNVALKTAKKQAPEIIFFYNINNNNNERKKRKEGKHDILFMFLNL